ncbi:NAD(P)-dependent dehydrogenase (short-subunit alcohol dehydrogenase family) [Haloferula luteola]|uniref:NAD(P)-dependent dehydrogenase (Short-subunit alcohol dehydrogenase family) n=1 Tax=Haloferula luteola TaxID=595692 RepID=A0A840VD24_9BACT|nr:3-ketoacyl-ACP reductase [Haloferula luteola]MBB5351709.1 NAD(P)-dependent dehydrogenase (short-subunit alcohol dehydrogenase family) [Haloferula luteola]
MITFITGGSRGIGLGIALALAKEGHRIAINGVRAESEIGPVLEQIREAGAPEAIYCQGNVGCPEDRQRMLEHLRSHFGALHFLVNNAGVAPAERRDVLETSRESFQRLIAINLEGPYFLTQAVAQWLIEQKQADSSFQGGIINVNSISATVASTNRGEYCVSKAGLAMVTQLFAARLGEYDLPVFEVRPGIIRTDMTAGVTEKYDRLLEDGLCVTPRWGLPDDVGKAVASLARFDFPYSTGQTIHIDGGLTLPRL